MQTFMFTWYKNVKYGEPLERHNLITISADSDIGVSAKRATEVFCKNFGSLKYNTIVSIQEIVNGEPVGEPIVPVEGDSIVPTKK